MLKPLADGAGHTLTPGRLNPGRAPPTAGALPEIIPEILMDVSINPYTIQYMRSLIGKRL